MGNDYRIIPLGVFRTYTPDPGDRSLARLAKAGAVFAKNGDGIDFYRLRPKGGLLASIDDEGRVVDAGKAPDGMFPVDGTLLVHLPDETRTANQLLLQSVRESCHMVLYNTG